jgi:hypothetical protein
MAVMQGLTRNDEGQRVGGLALFRNLILALGIAGFVAVYAWFVIDIWNHGPATAAGIDPQITYLAAAVGGVLASYFTFALGIGKSGPGRTMGGAVATVMGTFKQTFTLAADRPGPAIPAGRERISVAGTIAFWAYALVGLAIVVTATVKAKETPESIKGTAAVFTGYLTAVFTATFASRTGFDAGDGASELPDDGPAPPVPPSPAPMPEPA